MHPIEPLASREAPLRDRRAKIRFDRNECAGAFGDMGTDIPLLIGVTLAAGLDGTSVLVMFGLMQILTGFLYRMPMPVQPLKAMAAIVIGQKVPAETLYGAGLAVGVAMLVIAATGLLDWLARVVPKCVIRGIQFGLGLQLSSVALGKFIQADGVPGYILAIGAFAIIVLLLGNRRLPAAIPVVLVGVAYAVILKVDGGQLARSFDLGLPVLRIPQLDDVLAGLLVLALPQIPLSISNSVLATRQLAEDLFPECRLTVRRIGMTYSLMNLVNPLFGGMPTCHGSGGMAGHFAFGGRTGGSVILYGLMFLALGLFFGRGFDQITKAFPLPMLGVLLLFEGLALVWLLRDTARTRSEFSIALLVGLLAAGLPYGYAVALFLGTLLAHLGERARLVSLDTAGRAEGGAGPRTVDGCAVGS